VALTNSQYDQIKRIYDERLLARRREEEARLSYVNDKIDGFREVNDSISSLCLKQAELLLNGQTSALSDLKEAIALLKEQKSLLLQQAGLPSDYLQIPYVCNDCQDTGYIDGEKCHCFKQASLSLLYDQSNLKDYLESTDFSKVSDEYYSGQDLVHFRDSYEKSINFVNNFKNDYQNLCFYGTVGTGKSFLSGCIAKALMKDGYSVIYFSASGLIDLFSSYAFDYKSREESEEAYQDIYNCDLLIIDDLGTEPITQFTVSSLYNLINTRSMNEKQVMLNTNLSLAEMQKKYGDRIASRLFGESIILKFVGKDIRLQKIGIT
jgi:DNA replication protein DnaC